MPSRSKTPPFQILIFPTSSLNSNTYLTVVALKVIITVHGYHPYNVLTALKHGEPHKDEHSMVSPNPHPIAQKPFCSIKQIYKGLFPQLDTMQLTCSFEIF